jgi:hypothetical protein
VFSQAASKPLGTVGTSGTTENSAGFCVPTTNPASGNTGNKTGDPVADTARCSHSFPVCSCDLGTELFGVYAVVPAVPSVPTQIAEVSKKLVKPPASRSRSGIMHRLMGEFDRRLPRPRRSPLGCDGLMVCSPRLGDLLFVSLMGSYIWHHAALDQFRALYGVAMERGGVRQALSHTVRIRNSGRMAWSPNQLRRAKPALESEEEVGSSEFGADFAHFPTKHAFGIQSI